MKKKFLIFNIVIVTLSLLVVFISGITLNKSSHEKAAEAEVKTLAETYSSLFGETKIDEIVKSVPEEVRLTVIDKEGKVLGDSKKEELAENHLLRPEIQAAFAGNPKAAIRYSDTLKKTMVYYAVKADTSENDFVFIRTAIAVESVNEYVLKTVPSLVYALIVSLFISYIASILVANSLVKPLRDVRDKIRSIRNGNYTESVPRSGDDDINETLTEIDEISTRLSKSIAEAKSEKDRLDYILDNITDGIVVLESDGKIESVNKIAANIFPINEAAGKDFSVLTSDKTFNDGVASVLKGEKIRPFELGTDGKTFIVSAELLEKGFAVIVLSDITAVKNAEKTRSEFFANASHELKTPLTAIKGFNELIALQTTDDNAKKLSLKIEKEVARIVSLLNDMLDLSKLESGRKITPESVDLGLVARDVKESLSAIADEKGVTVEVSGDGTVEMEKEHAVELVKNLMENGIRYNEKGGHVKASVSESEAEVRLVVEDDGIGVEEKHIDRIFERFYRVDKSRSRESGGTGLGLAIVKHVCEIYEAKITFDSKLGSGTKVTVTVPKK